MITSQPIDSGLEIDGISHVAEPDPEPTHGLTENYPNPFSKTTTIRYSLPEPMHVRLTVFDMLGREVTVLVDEQQDGGIHTVDFDARGVPPGVYVARLQADALHFTKMMTVLR